LEPSIDSSDNFLWIGFPGEWLGFLVVVLGDEAVYGGL